MTTNAAHFTTEQVMAALHKAVEGKENYIDPRAQTNLACQYVLDGEPSCIVGVTLSLLGVSTETLEMMDNCGNPMFSADGLLVLEGSDVTMDSDARDVLIAAQNKQDRGETWGEALNAAVLKINW